MIRKNCLLCLVLVLSLSITKTIAQTEKGLGLGVRIGVNFADFTNSTGKPKAGLDIGAFTDYYITPRIGLELGTYYSQMGAQNHVELGTTTGKVDYNINYAKIDLIGKFHIMSGLRVMAGISGGVLLYAKKCFINQTGNKEYISIYKQLHPFEGGVTVGIGYTFRMGLDIQASFTRGFSPILKATNKYNSNFKLNFGWRFCGFDNKKNIHYNPKYKK